VSWGPPAARTGCTLTGYLVTGLDGGALAPVSLAAAATSTSFSGLGPGSASFAVIARFGTVASAAVAAAPVTIAALLPVCTPADLAAPSGLATIPSSTVAGSVAALWSAAPAPAGCPAVSAYEVMVNGQLATTATGGQTSATVQGLIGAGPFSLTVAVIYADSTRLVSGSLLFPAPIACTDATVALACPIAPPTPPGPPLGL
jgi:hypothetical protein